MIWFPGDPVRFTRDGAHLTGVIESWRHDIPALTAGFPGDYANVYTADGGMTEVPAAELGAVA